MPQSLIDWVRGDLSTAERIWSAMLPGLILGSYFLIGLVIYGVRTALRGRYRDAEVEARGTSILIGAHGRAYFAWVMQPIFTVLHKLDVPPNAITTLSVLLASAAGLALAVGRFALGGWLYMLAGACDFVDGRLARASGKANPAGAALDSVLDRYAESAVLVGLAWFYRDSWVLLAVLATLVGSMLIPYIRARGEGLGLQVKVGLMQRPERLVILGLTVALSPIIEAILVPADPHPIHRLAVVGLLFLAVTTHITALRRLVYVVSALEPESSGTFSNPLGRGGIVRNVVAAVLATGADFAVVFFLIKVAAVTPWLATLIGCIVGGGANFTINRVWTFASTAPPLPQAWRYVFTSGSSALLNAGGVAVLLLLPGLTSFGAWALARAVVFLTWNYPLHREYVYGDQDDPAETSPSLRPA